LNLCEFETELVPDLKEHGQWSNFN